MSEPESIPSLPFDQDASDIMGILLRSPVSDTAEGLTSAARAYAAIRAARKRGCLPERG